MGLDLEAAAVAAHRQSDTFSVEALWLLLVAN